MCKEVNAEKITESRKKVVAYMEKLSMTEWTPKESFVLYNPGCKGNTKMFCVFIAGETYKGMPYINITMSVPETFEKMREGAYIPWSGTEEQLKALTGPKDLEAIGGKLLDDAIKNAYTFPGNDCCSAVYFAWNTVLNNRKEIQPLQICARTIPGKVEGLLAVGEYDYSVSDRTDVICKTNGEQIMAKAYAKLQPGDAVSHVYETENGGYPRHVRLVYSYPHVEYTVDENGNEIIDMEKSYVLCLDQAGGAARRFIVGENRSTCQIHEWTFNALYNCKDLPITIEELVYGNSEDEHTYIDVDESEYTKNIRYGVLNGKVISNRQIITVRAVFEDSFGNKYECPGNLWLKKPYTPNYHRMEYDLADIDTSKCPFIALRDYTLNVYVCVSGTDGKEQNLIKDFVFKA